MNDPIAHHKQRDIAFCLKMKRGRLVRPLLTIHEDLALVFDMKTEGYHFTVKGVPKPMVKLQMKVHELLDYFDPCNREAVCTPVSSATD